MMPLRRLVLALALLLGASSASAESLEELVAQGRLSVSTAVEPASGAVPGQRLRLLITVSTPRWFTGGTRIVIPEVPDLVILQNQGFALNTTERRAGETWTTQRWSLDVFALRAGRFRIPPIELSTGVSLSAATTAQGQLLAPGVVIDIGLPEELEGLDHWVAAPAVTLEQTLNVGDEVALGDAIERTVTIRADDVMAMMLPESRFASHPNLQRYPQPPTLKNRSNRGTLAAERSDTVSYIASAPGEVTLPAMGINWWNTETRTLKRLEVPGADLTVVGELPPEPFDGRDLLPWIPTAMALAVLALLLRLALRLGLWQLLLRLAGRVHGAWVEFRQPGLLDRLNPGGSSGVSGASSRPAQEPGSREHPP